MEDLQLDEMLSYSFLEELRTSLDAPVIYPWINTKFKFEEWLASQITLFEGQKY